MAAAPSAPPPPPPPRPPPPHPPPPATGAAPAPAAPQSRGRGARGSPAAARTAARDRRQTAGGPPRLAFARGWGPPTSARGRAPDRPPPSQPPPATRVPPCIASYAAPSRTRGEAAADERHGLLHQRRPHLRVRRVQPHDLPQRDPHQIEVERLREDSETHQLRRPGPDRPVRLTGPHQIRERRMHPQDRP